MYFVQSVSRFDKDYKGLKKKFQKLNKDIDPLLCDLEKGEFPGEPIPKIHRFANTVYKARCAIKSANIGELGGLRVIYLVQETTIYLLAIYFKGERENMTQKEISEIISSSGL
ncbi:hypothetical protein [Candidatus Magnetominusculus dajiuhuensis]|uniref:hypothetical protein n=1 Tax=Candidatus Magnetominusculus dajiuhuensis TaxID=3137712 RepID=UPI003B42E5B7